MLGNFKKNFIFYAVVGLGSLYAMQNIQVSDGDFRFLETSFVSILEKLAAENKFEPVDLGIEKVTLKQIAKPNEDFNYYKYTANIIIRNYGGNLENGQLILQTGDNGKHAFVNNDDEGFSLAKGQAYIIENYELLFDGNYNGGKLTVEIELLEKVDYYTGNNRYEVDIFALPAKIQSLGIKEVKSDGSIELTFDPADYSYTNEGFEVYKTEALSFDEEDARYAEAEASEGEEIYSYYRIKNSESLLKNSRWSIMQGNDADPRNIKLGKDPFNDAEAHYVYLKSTNTQNGNYVVSSIIAFVPQKNLTRASFAKSFVEYADLDPDDSGKNYFIDVSEKDWYAPYVKTLHNLGLAGDGEVYFNPERIMTRGEALKVVADYFNVELVNIAKNQPFQDVTDENYLYPYLQALFASGKAGVFGENFQPEKAASRNLLKYLIYEYKKNS